MTTHSSQTQAILEALRGRAERHGDTFEVRGDRVTVRCLNPDKHQNGDANPSAEFTLGKYVVCHVCDLKLGEKRLAEQLGVGSIEGGLSLSELAEAKDLAEDFLASYGWRTQRTKEGQAAVAVPWYDLEGVQRTAPAYHNRHYVNKGDADGPRWTWDKPKNVKLILYGAWRNREWHEEAKSANIESYIWLCESELDAMTFWHHDVPANAYGGADFWKADWSKHLKHFQQILVVQEPDEAGQSAARSRATELQNSLPAAVISVVPFPEHLKDANGLHRAKNGDKESFQQELRNLVNAAIPASQLVAEGKAQDERARLEEHQKDIENAGDIIHGPELFRKSIDMVQALGVAGERRTIGLVRLSARSRVLPRPLNLEVNSPSSAGKTHVVTTTLKLEDPSAYYELTASSERALIYTDESLKHRIIFIQEPEGLAEGVGAAVMKSLTWEGRLRYATTVKEEGRYVGMHIEKEGPTGLIVATTRNLEDQLSNRLLRIEVDTSQDQTRRILTHIAQSANGIRPDVDLDKWHALSRALSEPTDVIIAYAEWLSDSISTTTLRIRRDFTQLLTLIKACAVEHRFQRTTTSNGTIIATVADYAMVHSLIADVFRAAQGEGVTQADRDMVKAVETLSKDASDKIGAKSISQAELIQHTNQPKSTVSYRAKRLLSLGYLVNLETGKGKPHKLVPGTTLPDEAKALPSPCELSEHLFNINQTELIKPWTDPVNSETHNCLEHVGRLDTLAETPISSDADCPTPPWTVNGQPLDGSPSRPGVQEVLDTSLDSLCPEGTVGTGKRPTVQPVQRGFKNAEDEEEVERF